MKFPLSCLEPHCNQFKSKKVDCDEEISKYQVHTLCFCPIGVYFHYIFRLFFNIVHFQTMAIALKLLTDFITATTHCIRTKIPHSEHPVTCRRI